MHFSVRLESTLQADWLGAMDRVADGIRHAVQTAVNEGVEEARRVRTFQDRTGKLFRSIQGQLVDVGQLGADGEITAGLDPRAPYASFVEGGTIHSRAYPFMGPAYLKAERVLEREVNAAIALAGEIVGR